MFKLLAILSRRPDLTPDAFRDYYENHHIPLVLSMAPMPRVYKRNYVVRGGETNPEFPTILRGGQANVEFFTIDFDVVTELAWDDRSGYESWTDHIGVPAIAEDEVKFLNRAKTRACVVEEHISAR